LDERKTRGLGILWRSSLPFVVSTGGFKKHGKPTSDWDEAATMRHALPQRGLYELEKHVGFIYSLF